jgi:hypothetical protein
MHGHGGGGGFGGHHGHIGHHGHHGHSVDIGNTVPPVGRPYGHGDDGDSSPRAFLTGFLFSIGFVVAVAVLLFVLKLS